MIKMRSANTSDIPSIVKLNAAVVDVTSPMDEARCSELMALCTWCIVADRDGEVTAFVMAMRDGAAYQNGNFAWFSQRLRNFVYIDRVVVGEKARGQGLGRKLYDAVANAARAQDCVIMCAEMNIDPPNDPSLTFHRLRGFGEIGRRRLDKGVTVSMQVSDIADP